MYTWIHVKMSGLRFRPSIGFRGNFGGFRGSQENTIKINKLKRDRILSRNIFIFIKQLVKNVTGNFGGKVAVASYVKGYIPAYENTLSVKLDSKTNITIISKNVHTVIFMI